MLQRASGGQVFELELVQLHGAGAQPGFERGDVAALEPDHHPQRPHRDHDRQSKQERRRAHRHQQQCQPHDPGSDRLAEPIAADVDEGLGGTLLGRGDRCVQQLVAGSEQ